MTAVIGRIDHRARVGSMAPFPSEQAGRQDRPSEGDRRRDLPQLHGWQRSDAYMDASLLTHPHNKGVP